MTDTELAAIGDIQGIAERPKSLDPNDLYGTEDITREELRLPRLAIAQGLSPQITEGDSAFIPELKPNDMFNDLTGEVYGRGPMTFVPLQRAIRIIEFTPRSEGGGVVDMDVPRGDPRTKWTGVGQERQPPVATEFSEFVVLLLRPGRVPEPIVISIKSTNKFNRRAADQLTTFIKLRNAPIYAGLYTVASAPEKNSKGTFGVPIMKNTGFIPKDTPAGAALYAHAERYAKSLEGKKIVVQREPGDETEFDAPAGTTDM